MQQQVQPKKRSNYRSIEILMALARMACEGAYSENINTWWPGPVTNMNMRAKLILHRAQQHSIHANLQRGAEVYLISTLRHLLECASYLSKKNNALPSRHFSVQMNQESDGRYVTFVGLTPQGKAFLDSLEQEELAYVLTH